MTKKNLANLIDGLVCDVAVANGFDDNDKLDVARAFLATTLKDMTATIVANSKRFPAHGGPRIGPDGRVAGGA